MNVVSRVRNESAGHHGGTCWISETMQGQEAGRAESDPVPRSRRLLVGNNLYICDLVPSSRSGRVPICAAIIG